MDLTTPDAGPAPAPVPASGDAAPRRRRLRERTQAFAGRLLDDLARIDHRSDAALHGPRLTLATIAALVLAFLLWAAWFPLDELVRAEGRLIPPQRVMSVQSAEAGVVAAVAVDDGAHVRAGQTLVVLDDRNVRADLAEAREPYLTGLATLARLEAALQGTPVRFPAALDGHAAIRRAALEAAASERAVLEGTLAAIDGRIAQRRAQRQATQTEWRQRMAEQRLLGEQRETLRPLVPGVVSQSEWLAREREWIALQGAIDTLSLHLVEHDSALRELQAERARAQAEQRAQWAREAATLRPQIEMHRARLQARQAQVGRTEVTAPVDGVVKQLHVRVAGQVVPAGAPVLDLVPASDHLLVEARVSPADVGFVTRGQAVRVKVSAYDFAVHGAMDGVVEDISADTLTDREAPQLPPHYRVMVVVREPLRDRQGRALPLTPGMTVSLDIVTGQRRLLTYLMKPLARGWNQALGER